MNVELIRERLKDFRPFAVVTSGGHRYPVPHPDFLFLTARSVVVADRKGNVAVLDPLRVVALEDLSLPKNGRAKRR